MTTYIIGDIQGCKRTLDRLITRIYASSDNPQLICTGDLVNRGPHSLEVLRWAMNHGIRTVLGNHDLYLLAVWSGAIARKNDTLDETLRASDIDTLCEWLRTQPFALELEKQIVVHAAAHPEWTDGDIMRWSAELQNRLLSDDWVNFLKASWDGRKRRQSKAHWALSVLTRCRYLSPDSLTMESFKGSPEHAPPHCIPWYTFPRRSAGAKTIIFGHWAALGHRQLSWSISLDGGAVWGGNMVAWCIETGHAFEEPVHPDDVFEVIP